MENRLTEQESKALRFIRNQIIFMEESPSVRDVMEELGYESPRSAFLLIQKLITKGYLRRKANKELQVVKDPFEGNDNIIAVEIPLVGAIPCGAPLLAEENVEARIPVDSRIAKPGHSYFILRADGNSMDKVGINDGDLILLRQEQTAEPGQIVAALINDAATLKLYSERNDHIVLEPRSSSASHKPIILTEDFQIQGIFVSKLPDLSRDLWDESE